MLQRMSRASRASFGLAAFLLSIAGTSAVSQGTIAREVDTDRDGLSDFHETHKYLTDPKKKDSDGDGIVDADWNERREYTYTVRTVLQVMRPVTPDVLCDDYQDARILDETDEYVELEVVHYPLNTVAEAIVANPKWRREAKQMREWTEPGPTANWDDELRDGLIEALAEDGIRVGKLDDRELVEKASRWLLKHASYNDGFTTFCSRFVDGKAEIHPGLEEAAARGVTEKGLTVEEQWERELFAKGMFEHGVRGSCTSSAIYLNGCLRALGIPTRIVLAVPLVDASDERELEMVKRGIRHRDVRWIVGEGVGSLGRSWASHTFNEVWVGGRWRRLNYSRLGQNILSSSMFGMITHVATFSDWADGEMASTWGTRQAHGRFSDDAFGGANPYSTITVSDRFGRHAKIDVAAATAPEPATSKVEAPATLTIDRVVWSDAPDSPTDSLPGVEPVLLCHVGPAEDFPAHKAFTRVTDPRFFLEADGHPTLKVGTGVGGVTTQGESYVMISLGPADWEDIVEGVEYRLRSQNSNPDHLWKLAEDFRVKR